jgi:hypothetical protein
VNSEPDDRKTGNRCPKCGDKKVDPDDSDVFLHSLYSDWPCKVNHEEEKEG